MPRSRNVQPHPQLSPIPQTKTVVKRPLQDITDRFVPAVQTSRPPTPKPRASEGTFGAKLRSVKPSGFPSSLPPSSPPSVSSAFVLPVPDHHTHPQSPSNHVSDVENVDPEFEPEEDIDNELDTLDNSDPFGFFAVEQKLKSLRAHQHDRPPRYRALPPPQINTMISAEHFITPATIFLKNSSFYFLPLP